MGKVKNTPQLKLHFGMSFAFNYLEKFIGVVLAPMFLKKGDLFMKLICRFLTIVIFCGVNLTILRAASPKASQDRIDQLVNSYFYQLSNKSAKNQRLSIGQQVNLDPVPPVSCLPQPGSSCVDAACAKLGTFGCDTIDEVTKVATACRGNFDGGCLSVLCTKLGTFGCDTMDEISQVAADCRGNYGGGCVSVVCGKLGTFGCDTMSEVQAVGAICQGNYNGDCIASTCARLGTFGCDTLDEVTAVARACSGN